MRTVPPEIVDRLARYQQSHVLRWWNELSDVQQERLLSQIEQMDFDQIARVRQAGQKAGDSGEAAAAARIERARAPAAVVRQPESASEEADWTAAVAVGEQLLRHGQVAVLTVAGGQGTRLGFDHPKGLFPIGPLTDRTLFRIFAEQILARRRRHGAVIPWMVMTSDATHDETEDYFEAQQFFGLGRDSVAFFRQGALPAVDAATGRLLMESAGHLCLSPDGHGGVVSALQRSGLLHRMQTAGIEHVFYHQVDNPTVIVCDPALLGFHVQRQSQLTTCVVRKTSPSERMGVLVDLDGHTEIIEYSEMTADQAARQDSSGQWMFWAGNTAIHVFARTFLQQLAQDGGRLPLHMARKNVAFLDESGQQCHPQDQQQPNAVKFERFIFDALPLASSTLIVEGDRPREFNPVKNREGADSPETARQALSRIGRDWLKQAGVDLPAGQVVEISPLVALDGPELGRRLAAGEITLAELTG